MDKFLEEAIDKQRALSKRISSLTVKLDGAKEFSERKEITDEMMDCAKRLGELDTTIKELCLNALFKEAKDLLERLS